MPLRFRGMLVILIGALIAGCGAPDEQRRGEERTPNLSSAVLGDLRTLDPCTLTDPAALAALGEVSEVGTVSMDYCLQHVRMPDGSLVQLATGALENGKPEPGEPVVRKGRLRIAQAAPLPGHCASEVVFTDDITMRVSADLLTGDPGAGLCGVAEAGADAVVAAIENDRVGHRRVPPNSLALIDPCTVLGTDVVRRIPGLERARAQRSPAGHRCQWGRQESSAPRVRLTYTAGEPPKVLHGAAVEEQIAGRRTVVSVVGGNPRVPLCSAETGHIPFGSPESGQREVAMLVVALPGTNGIKACEFARGLAEQAWPRLLD